MASALTAFRSEELMIPTQNFINYFNVGITMFRSLFCIGAGSFAGGIARYLISKAIESGNQTVVPFGTMTVNVLGCLLIGLLYGVLERYDLLDSNWQLFLIVGFCGGFTTFSTFMNENFQLTRDGNILLGALYTSISLAGGFLLLALGHFMIKCYG